MDLTTPTNRTNIQRLADYINGRPNPELFEYTLTLAALAKPRQNDLVDPNQEMQIVFR